jgi:hypothetical protein
MKDEIILYRPDELAEHIEVRLEDDTVWLSQQQMATLFNQTKQNISLHINNCFKEGELVRMPTVKESLTVQKEGNRTVKRKIELYNLDVIISVGYRVKSKQGTQFRIWATRILRDYLLKGYALNNRMNRIEGNVQAISEKVNQIELQINSHLIPTQGVFFDGQIFDAYELASRIIRAAKKSIVLIDNYIDENTLTHLTKKNKGVKVHLLTKNINKQLALDILKANEQYGNFEVKVFAQSHDRFLIIDGKEVYHLGASLKDLGKKWFAFSKLEAKSVENIINSILELI